jgi:hypothetical protein
MNRRCFNVGAVVLLCVLLLSSTSGVFAQRFVDVQAGYGTLQAAISADSANRVANPNTVYRVHRGTADSVYYLTSTLTNWGSMPLRIEAVGTGALPTFICATLSDGSVISPMISAKANFSLKGVYLNGTNTLGAIVDRVVRIQASPVRVDFDSCQMNWSSQSFIRVDNTNARIFLKNCRVGNIYSDWANARGVDNRGITIDTLSMVGCSFYRLAFRVYRDGGGILTYGYFDHNTFTEVADAILGLGSTKSITYTNNLAVNCGFLGKGKSSNLRLLTMTPLPSGQSAYVANNVFYSDSTALLAAYRAVSDSIVAMPLFADTLAAFINAAGLSDKNIVSPVTFTMAPNNIVKAIKLDSIARWYWRNQPTSTTDASILKVDSIKYLNLAYNTSAPAYTFGSDGKPAGATEWFGSAVGGSGITSNGTGGGLWNAPSTWAGGVVPTGSETITIAATDSIVYNVPVSITGTLVKKSTKRDSIGTGGSITFANGGTYQHDVNAGYIPTATWATGSTYLLTGFAGNKPQNGNQNFYNVTFNLTSAYAAAADLGWANNIIGGTLRATNTNSTQVRLTSPTAVTHGPAPITVTINGDFIVDSTSSVGLNGSSTADTAYMIIKGNIVSRGTVSMGGSGLINNWYVQGNISLLGGSFITNSAAPADTLILNGTKKQTFVTTLASMTQVRTLVRTGAIVDLDTNRLGSHSQQAFILEPEATVITAHPLGLVGNINTSAAKILSKSASFVYDGIVAQADTLLPDTVKSLTINNPAGFTLSRKTVVTGVLTLQAGQLDNSVNAVLIAPGGSVVKTGGSTKVGVPGWPITSVDSQDGSVPRTFDLAQNYPNPFNPSTTIQYSIPKATHVTVRVYNLLGEEIETLVDQSQTAGSYSLRFDASRLASGMYFYQLKTAEFVSTKKMILTK